MIINPFITSGYVAPEYFCDRKKETETLLRWLTNGKSCSHHVYPPYGENRINRTLFQTG